MSHKRAGLPYKGEGSVRRLAHKLQHSYKLSWTVAKVRARALLGLAP